MVKKLTFCILALSVITVHGADQNLQTKFNRAVSTEDCKLAEELLKAGGIDVNALISRTPLIIEAAENFDIPMMDLLLVHGADAHATDFEGDNVLHKLAGATYMNQNNTRIAQLIRECTQLGVSLTARNKNHQTPLSLAAGWSDNIQAIEALMVHDATLKKEAISSAIAYNEPKNISVLLLHGAAADGFHKAETYLPLDNSFDTNIKKNNKCRDLVAKNTRSEYFLKHCFGQFKTRLNDKRNTFHIVKGREIGNKR